MTIGIKASTDGLSAALQLGGVDLLTMDANGVFLPAGKKFRAPGAVIAVYNQRLTTVVSSTGSATLLSQVVTPQNINSKFLIISQTTMDIAAGGSNAYGQVANARNGGNIGSIVAGLAGAYSNTMGITVVSLDAPATTAAVTYSSIGLVSSGGTASWSAYGSASDTRSSLTIIEFAG
jgi:hypothetical protein